MLKSNYFKLSWVFRGYHALGAILLMVVFLMSGCANQQANVDGGTAEFSAMEMPSDAVGYQPDGIDMEAYGIDY